ncbi:MAG: VacJ family lipoprotein [Beijerinckiaceae bacterium]|nr:VacJ family lipoprotein [Beijerinckiaceae bacterium]
MMPDGPERAQMLRANALDTSDPYEQTNRAVFNANNVVYDIALRPVAGAYITVVPSLIRQRISSGINNLEEPRILANNILQLRPNAAYKTFGRFMINSTLGVGGLFDVATWGGLERQTGDFGQTLYVYGVSSGPYLVLPIFGPSTVRDTVGKIVDEASDPGTYAIDRVGGFWPTLAIGVVGSLERIDGLDDVEAGSIDAYSRLRSVYLQKRASELGDAVGLSVTPGLDKPTTPITDTAPIKVNKAKTKRRRAKHHG